MAGVRYRVTGLLLIMVMGVVGLRGSVGAVAETAAVPPTIHLPHLSNDLTVKEHAVFWFGDITPTNNFADVRAAFSDEQLSVFVHVYDRLVYLNDVPTVADIEQWDAVTLNLQLDGNSGSGIDAQSFRFTGHPAIHGNPTGNRAVYQGSGGSWSEVTLDFSFNGGRQTDGVSDQKADKGFWVAFKIPFESLGFSGPPAEGTVWGVGVTVHDRDDGANTAIADRVWPDGMNASVPGSYGRFSFGIPSYTPEPAANVQTTTIRHGENGNVVEDAHVGGDSICGSPYWPDKFYTHWPNANYAGDEQINIQNQFNLGDWPCFSKYLVNFPLDDIPEGKVIVTAELRMYQFGNAGQGWTPGPEDSIIQVLRTRDGFEEATVTWNSAPQVQENVSSALATTIPSGGAGYFVSWDVSRAVAEAHAANDPLNFALYSADNKLHSGKYFVSSDGANSHAERRPTLFVEWGDPPLNVTPELVQIESSGSAAYTISADGLGNSVSLSVTNPAPGDLTVSLSKSTLSPPETAVLTVNDASGTSRGLYEIRIRAEGDVVAEKTVYLLVGGEQIYLPLIKR